MRNWLIVLVSIALIIVVLPQLLLTFSWIPLPLGTENLAEHLNNATSPIISTLTLVGVFITFFQQRRANSNQIAIIEKNHTDQMKYIREENAFNYVDTLFKKFNENRTDQFLKGIESSIKKGLNNLRSNRSPEKNFKEYFKMILHPLNQDVENLKYLSSYIKESEFLDVNVKILYIEKIKEKFKKLMFKECYSFALKIKGEDIKDEGLDFLFEYVSQIREEIKKCNLE